MSQDYEIHIPDLGGVVIGMDADYDITVGAYDEYEHIHLEISTGKTRKIASALIDLADRADLMAKEAKP